LEDRLVEAQIAGLRCLNEPQMIAKCSEEIAARQVGTWSCRSISRQEACCQAAAKATRGKANESESEEDELIIYPTDSDGEALDEEEEKAYDKGGRKELEELRAARAQAAAERAAEKARQEKAERRRERRKAEDDACLREELDGFIKKQQLGPLVPQCASQAARDFYAQCKKKARY
ncbi:unnamed protein product, partial [Vitrella brassicaformis CCMP3155]